VYPSLSCKKVAIDFPIHDEAPVTNITLDINIISKYELRINKK
jgi:hypothetical protein